MNELEIKGVSKTFAAVHALTEANFSASEGEVHAILGANGAGKSTLIKILSGFQRADQGTITLNGKQLDIYSPKEAVRLGIGTVYQELSLMHDLTVAQNLFYEQWPGKRAGLIDRRKMEAKAAEILERYGASEIDPREKVSNIPLSQQQIIEIIKVIIRDPKIIIFDEATSALTANKVDWLLKLMRKLADEKRIVLFISHRLQEIKDGCDRITVFRNGKDVGVRDVATLDDDEIVSMMLGKKLDSFYPEYVRYTRENAILEVKDLRIDGELEPTSFELLQGEVLGVGGLAGQGQIPLFLAIGGVERHEGGVVIDGKAIHAASPKECLKHGIALIPEDRSREGLVQMLSIRSNLSMPVLKQISHFSLIDRAAENKNVEDAISRLSIKLDSPEANVSELSGGNQQKVLISKFLVTSPKAFLMIDPTRGVDVGTKSEIFKLVRRLAEQGFGVLYYSTDMEELLNICDRVMVMCDNKVADILTDGEITKENILKISIGKSIRN